jgi:hypothetical protein
MSRFFFLASILMAGLAAGLGLVRSSLGEESEKPAQSAAEEAESVKVPKELFTGKVVLLGEALKAKGITAFEEMHKQVALETEDGELIPLVADWRGRAFFQDKRLRDRKVQLVGTRKPGVPYLQVLMVFTFDKTGQRMYTDYWCDVCSIPMYEIKPCDCCQGDIRLRFEPQALPDYLPKSKADKTPAEKTGP